MAVFPLHWRHQIHLFFSLPPPYSLVLLTSEMLPCQFRFTPSVPIIRLYRVFFMSLYTKAVSPRRVPSAGTFPKNCRARQTRTLYLAALCVFQISRRSASPSVSHCRAISACPVQARKAFAEDWPIHLLCIVLSNWQGSLSTSLRAKK